ncbi:MAG TPA: hypothetical protein VGJ44_23115 [Kribbellaceae bacterium]
MEQLDRLGEDLDEDPTAASHYALRAAMHGDAGDAVWAPHRCFDAALAAAEAEIVVGPAVTKADADAKASSPIVQDEFRRQIEDLALFEEHGLTREVQSTLQRR